MLIIFLICSFTQILFWGLCFARFAFYRKPKPSLPSDALPPVSVIICARNEAANLRKNLSKILSQDYPLFEVLVVEDASEDESATILADFAAKYPNLRIIYKKEKKEVGKKEALVLGLQNACYDWFLLTDADAMPASDQWISGMMKTATKNAETKMVLGFGPYLQSPECINLWIRFETNYVAIQYFSAAIWKIPYMGVGRNLLYNRALYESHRTALTQHSDIASGDDDLFVSAAANGNNTEICLDPKTFIYSEPKHSLLALYKQKTRHYSTATRYSIVHQLFLTVLSVSLLGFWGLMPFALIENTGITMLMILVRICIIFVIWSKVLRILGDKSLLKYILLLDLLSPFYFLVFAPSLFLKNSSQWK